MAELIRLENIRKSYGENEVLKNITISIQEKEFVTLLGPSGCGKTTTLRILGGFENPDSGRILFDGKDITNVPSNRRNLNTVFQNYALFPHMTVGDNVAFGLRVKGMNESDVKEKVHYGLKLVNLEGYENRKISQMSGGQQQRVAMARAIVNEPKVLLLDEPLGALDLKLRQEMQYELVRLKHELGITFIYVTHDQEEALTMSDKVIVMNSGRIRAGRNAGGNLQRAGERIRGGFHRRQQHPFRKDGSESSGSNQRCGFPVHRRQRKRICPGTGCGRADSAGGSGNPSGGKGNSGRQDYQQAVHRHALRDAGAGGCGRRF